MSSTKARLAWTSPFVCRFNRITCSNRRRTSWSTISPRSWISASGEPVSIARSATGRTVPQAGGFEAGVGRALAGAVYADDVLKEPLVRELLRLGRQGLDPQCLLERLSHLLLSRLGHEREDEVDVALRQRPLGGFDHRPVK